jgi:hypothetical protein
MNDRLNKPTPIRDPAFKLIAGRPQPEFMVIGGAKCGTTSFSYYLPLHPQVRECLPKEPNFWSWQLVNRLQYQELFVNKQPLSNSDSAQMIGGEYSTSYLPHPLVPRRVAARLPAIKLIVLLRNPIDRAYSHYMMAKDAGAETECNFTEIIAREMEEVPELLAAHQRGFLDNTMRSATHRCTQSGAPIHVAAHDRAGTRYALSRERDLFRYYTTSYLLRSVYYDQMWRWLQLFDRAQMLVIDSHRLLSDRLAVMHEVVEFLALDPFDFNTADLERTWRGARPTESAPGDYEPLDETVRAQLKTCLQPYNERLFELLGMEFNW